jgi:hypothetical protein
MFDDIIKPAETKPRPNCPWLYEAITSCVCFENTDGNGLSDVCHCDYLMKDNTCQLMKTRIVYKEVDLSHRV